MKWISFLSYPTRVSSEMAWKKRLVERLSLENWIERSCNSVTPLKKKKKKKKMVSAIWPRSSLDVGYTRPVWATPFEHLSRLCLCRVVFWRRTGFIRWSRCTGYHTRDTLLDLARVTFPKVNIGDRSRCRLMLFGSRCQPATRKDASVVGQGEGELAQVLDSIAGYHLVRISFPDTDYSSDRPIKLLGDLGKWNDE